VGAESHCPGSLMGRMGQPSFTWCKTQLQQIPSGVGANTQLQYAVVELKQRKKEITINQIIAGLGDLTLNTPKARRERTSINTLI